MALGQILKINLKMYHKFSTFIVKIIKKDLIRTVYVLYYYPVRFGPSKMVIDKIQCINQTISLHMFIGQERRIIADYYII